MILGSSVTVALARAVFKPPYGTTIVEEEEEFLFAIMEFIFHAVVATLIIIVSTLKRMG